MQGRMPAGHVSILTLKVERRQVFSRVSFSTCKVAEDGQSSKESCISIS